MEWGGPELAQGRSVHRRAIADMALQSVAREARGQPPDQPITRLFGEHTGCGNGQATAITLHQGDLPARPGS